MDRFVQLIPNPVLPELELPLDRSRDVEERDTGICYV